MSKEEEKLQLLRDILLIDDREIAKAIDTRLNTITETLDKKDKLSKKIDPILEERLEEFIKEMPSTLGPTITKTLKEQIENSRDQVVEALYPIMGKMIKRYVQNEMKLLSEKINNNFKVFSFNNLKRKVTSKVTGVKQGDLLLNELNDATIEEIFIIQKGSGLLLGNYSNTEVIDKELISGMLTAIKSFTEDAFNKGNQNLETIEYELFTLHIQNFHTFYIAAAISGAYTQSFENKLEDLLLTLSEKLSKKIATLSKEEIDSSLNTFFKK
ncbi:cell envelope biogenesis protein OmpA [Patiriisocius hiemis]|uniref:Cell envelope biogenesis protein OmpA n=1 Tax=Patiriisocius hiemis TaxID=3075604 RepID=A0ABU2YE96_9FLAO|nr:cell envelope biogenesis protein OmpA [Constantimarinum sp. W242]MDT0555373.1 cell envelope biogenesis protein OmpA [Constantimarinum sp. W242]